MFEKDYLMRLFATLINALNRIINCIEADDIENAKIQLDDAYQLLGNNASYFYNTDISEIIHFFKNKDENYLEKVKFLSELMYYDSLIQSNVEIEKDILKKAIHLLEYHNNNTNIYSLELNNKLISMKEKLSLFPH